MATELAKAYVQIAPVAKGIAGMISNEIGGEAQSAGASAGNSLAGSLVKSLVGGLSAAAIGKVISDTIKEGAQLEQSIGGIETLFKESADTMKQYAAEAYRTAGISANDYMQQATSFSASLLSSLGGDTAQAADAANQAIIDMADNANKMGTSLDSIQNAYQGFAKQNYTMLDNLKLGYGGTKQEMERLLQDAEKFSGVHYDISNLNDVYSAIHVIQGELGITGTTAEEAAGTLSGSFESMKAAVKNLMGNLVVGEDIKNNVIELINATVTFVVDNLVPAFLNIGNNLKSMIDDLIASGAIPELLAKLPDVIVSIVNYITANFPAIFQTGVNLLGQLALGLLRALPGLLSNIPGMIKSIMDAIIRCNVYFVDAGINLVKGLWQGMSNSLGWIKDKIRGWVGNVVSFLKNLFGIHSPSRVMRDQVGKYLAMGVAEGITDNSYMVNNAMDDLTDGVNASLGFGSFSGSTLSGGTNNVSINVYGAEGQDVRQLASIIMDEIQSAVNRKEAVFA